MLYSLILFWLLCSAFAVSCDQNLMANYIRSRNNFNLSYHVNECTPASDLHINCLIELSAQLGNVQAIRILSRLGGERTLTTALSFCQRNGLLIQAREILSHAYFFPNAQEVINQMAFKSSSYSEFFDLLLEFGADINFKTRNIYEQSDTTLLIRSVIENSPEKFTKLLESGADINSQEGEKSALEVAVQYSRPEMIKALLIHGADLTSCHVLPKIAAASLDFNVLEMLVGAGMPFVPDEEIFEAALLDGNASVLDYLLTKYTELFDLSQPPAHYCSLIHFIMQQRLFENRAEVIDVLIRLNTPFRIEDFSFCCRVCYLKTILKVIERLPKPFDISEYIFILASNRNQDVINHFYPLFMATNPSPEQLQSLMLSCVRGNHIHLFVDLVARGVDVNYLEYSHSDSILTEGESVEAVAELLRLGADIDLNGPIIRLLLHDKEDIIKYLLQRGAKPSYQGNHPGGVRYHLARNASTDLRQFYTQYGYEIPQMFIVPTFPLALMDAMDQEN